MKQYDFNPKSMQRNQLLGHIDLDTRQWSDGVLTLYSLQVASETQGTQHILTKAIRFYMFCRCVVMDRMRW